MVPANPFEIAGRIIPPGKRERILIPVASLYIQAPIELVVIIVNGEKPGPRLLVSAAIHGDEINGIFIIREILQKVEPAQLRGTLITVPVVNGFGVIHQSRYLPDRRDLNRSFPGSSKGSLAACLAHIFMKEIVHKATHLIDLHTAAIHRNNYPQIRANLEDAKTHRLANAFGAPIMIHANLRDGSLRQAANLMGIPSLLYEAGEALRYNRDCIEIGTKGVLNVMQSLHMIPPSAHPHTHPKESFKSKWIRATKSGFFVSEVKLGEIVKKDQRIGTILLRLHHEFFQETEIELHSPHRGMVIGLTQNPLVYKGDALAHIAKL